MAGEVVGHADAAGLIGAVVVLDAAIVIQMDPGTLHINGAVPDGVVVDVAVFADGAEEILGFIEVDGVSTVADATDLAVHVHGDGRGAAVGVDARAGKVAKLGAFFHGDGAAAGIDGAVELRFHIGIGEQRRTAQGDLGAAAAMHHDAAHPLPDVGLIAGDVADFAGNLRRAAVGIDCPAIDVLNDTAFFHGELGSLDPDGTGGAGLVLVFGALGALFHGGILNDAAVFHGDGGVGRDAHGGHAAEVPKHRAIAQDDVGFIGVGAVGCDHSVLDEDQVVAVAFSADGLGELGALVTADIVEDDVLQGKGGVLAARHGDLEEGGIVPAAGIVRSCCKVLAPGDGHRLLAGTGDGEILAHQAGEGGDLEIRGNVDGGAVLGHRHSFGEGCVGRVGRAIAVRVAAMRRDINVRRCGQCRRHEGHGQGERQQQEQGTPYQVFHGGSSFFLNR